MDNKGYTSLRCINNHLQQLNPKMQKRGSLQKGIKETKTRASILPIALLIFSTLLIISVSQQPQQQWSAHAIVFGSAKNLSDNDGISINPQIEVSGKNVYTTWQDDSPPGDFDLLFKRSTDNGASFRSSVDLSRNIDGSASAQKVFKSGNDVYVVWSQNEDIFFRKSTDNGAHFGSAINLSKDEHSSDNPQISVSGNVVYVTWVDRFFNETADSDESQVFLKKSTNNGNTFGGVKVLSNTKDESVGDLRIASIKDSVYVAWTGGEFNEPSSDDCPFDGSLNFAKSTNGGSSFGLKKITDICQPFGMNLKAVGSSVFLVWGDRPSADESPEIFFTKSANSGSKFGGIKNLSNNEGDSSNPQIDVLGSNVYVAWEDNSPGNLDILFKSSWDYGAHFGKVKKLSNNEGISINPKISSSGTAVRIVWQDTTPSNNEIFFRSSADKGNTFGVTKNLSKNEGESINPEVVSGDGFVHVVWQDGTFESQEILYKRGT